MIEETLEDAELFDETYQDALAAALFWYWPAVMSEPSEDADDQDG